MTTLPLALNWKRLPHVGTKITWTAETYQHLSAPPSKANEPKWRSLPFEPIQMDKLPARSGFYAFVYIYHCLGFPKQEIIMYVGESSNLRKRFKEYEKLAEGEPEGGDPSNPSENRRERLKYLFATFKNLTVRYCTTKVSQEERRETEQDLISLLDPPFNWKHRATPTQAPIIGRPGSILVKTKDAEPAFAD